MLKHSLSLMSCFALTSLPATAAPSQAVGGEGFLDSVAACRASGDRSERLTCYDRVADQLAEARKKNEITVLSRRQVDDQRRAVFGLSVDDDRLFKRSAQPLPRIEALDTSVTQVATAGRGIFRVTLADGSVWRTTEEARIDPAVGDPVHIRRGALGSYLASFRGARSLRIQRLR